MRITPRAVGTLWDEVTDELVARCVGLELATISDAETMDGCGRERGHLRMDWWQYCRPEGT